MFCKQLQILITPFPSLSPYLTHSAHSKIHSELASSSRASCRIWASDIGAQSLQTAT
jgi:hypothetical protein